MTHVILTGYGVGIVAGVIAWALRKGVNNS